MHLNVEIKARCADPGKIRKILLDAGADFRGTDEQEDTYFNVPDGRLKLRLGAIEKSLIYYNRDDMAGPKTSEVTMMEVTSGEPLKTILEQAIGVKVVVTKKREIYFINNVKFHLDTVPTLGSFVEIEAIDRDGLIGKQILEKQCNHYMALFEITEADLLNDSYSDMLMQVV